MVYNSRLGWILLGFLFFYACEGSLDTIRKQKTFVWSGGEPICRECSFGGIHTESFACSASNAIWDVGGWNNGTQYFHDPLSIPYPHDYVLSQISVSILGVFNCRTDHSTTDRVLQLQLNNHVVSHWEWKEFESCVCANCANEISYESPQVDEFPAYNYSGINEMKLLTEFGSVICVSQLRLNLTFTRDGTDRYSTPIMTSESSTHFLEDIKLLGIIVVFVIGASLASMLACVMVKKYKGGPEDEGYQRFSQLEMGFRKKGAFQIQAKELELGDRIGKGSYGEVFRADWRGITVAVKRMPIAILDNPELLKDFNQEAGIMAQLRHPNVLQFLGTCLFREPTEDICIVTEYMACGSLHRLLHDEEMEISWDLVKRFALDTAQGMLYLHDSSPAILHRDLKSHNLLVDSNLKVKISDFGLSKVVEEVGKTMTSCGTASWAAPEVLKQAKYTEKADVYSYGMCLWEFFTRKDPYEGMPTYQIIYNVVHDGIRPTIPEECPLDYAELIRECWSQQPELRPSFSEIIRKLKRL